jgi:hypothetical protein
MGEETRELTAVKVLSMIGILFWFLQSINYFIGFGTGTEIFILYGILELVFALYMFIAIKYWDLIPLKLPYFWWLLLIFGVLSLIFGAASLTGAYTAGIIITMAALIEFFGDKKGWKASKMMALLGAALGIYECIVIFYGATMLPVVPAEPIVAAVFGLIFAIILIILIFDLVDIRIPYEWWVLLIIGFMFFTWFSIYAGLYALLANVPLAGLAGIIILIAFVLLAFGF